jgi:hypothetical protein
VSLEQINQKFGTVPLVSAFDFDSCATPSSGVEVSIRGVSELRQSGSKSQIIRKPLSIFGVPTCSRIVEIWVRARPDCVHIVVILCDSVGAESGCSVVLRQLARGLLQSNSSYQNTHILVEPTTEPPVYDRNTKYAVVPTSWIGDGAITHQEGFYCLLLFLCQRRIWARTVPPVEAWTFEIVTARGTAGYGASASSIALNPWG